MDNGIKYCWVRQESIRRNPDICAFNVDSAHCCVCAENILYGQGPIPPPQSPEEFLRIVGGLRRELEFDPRSSKAVRFALLHTFRLNIKKRICSTSEMLKAVYDDSAGDKYWSDWLQMEMVNAKRFLDLLSIHGACDLADTHTSFDPNACKERCETVRRQTFLLLQQAVRSKELAIVGPREVLLSSSIEDTECIEGLTYKDAKDDWPKAIKVYPRQTVHWFARLPERATLLPSSLRSWLMRNTLGNADRYFGELALDHSDDFRSVRLHGRVFTLTPNQARIIEILWEAREKGFPCVAQAEIIERINPDLKTNRLRDVFGSSDEDREKWKELVKKEGRKDTYRLNV